MSDLITTTQDTYRNACIATFGRCRRRSRSPSAPRRDRGQTAAEYMGVLLARRRDHHRRRRHPASARRSRTRSAPDQRHEGRQAGLRRRRRKWLRPSLRPPTQCPQDPPVNRRVLRVSGTFGPCRDGSRDPGGGARAAVALIACPSAASCSASRFACAARRARADRAPSTSACCSSSRRSSPRCCDRPGPGDQRQALADRARHRRRAASLACGGVVAAWPRASRCCAGVRARGARAQTSDTRNRALIVLDASKSMNEDAGNGGTRLDAAKQAVDALVDRLPEGAPLGLRVYGSKVSEVSRAEGCRDTELTVPVGPLDKDALRSTVNALEGKGRTPIGSSLLAVPGRPRHRGGAAQRGPGHRRRRQLRAAGPVQGGARRSPSAASRCRSRSSASRSTSACAGSCAASREAGGGSYVDVARRRQARRRARGAALARVPLLRADRDRGRGRRSSRAGDRARRRAVFQTIPLQGRRATRWFAIDVPAGRRAFVSLDGDPAARARAGDGRSCPSSTRPPAAGRLDRVRATRTSTARGSTTPTARPAARACGCGPGDPPGRYVLERRGSRRGGRVRARARRPGRDRGAVRQAGRRGRAS